MEVVSPPADAFKGIVAFGVGVRLSIPTNILSGLRESSESACTPDARWAKFGGRRKFAKPSSLGAERIDTVSLRFTIQL